MKALYNFVSYDAEIIGNYLPLFFRLHRYNGLIYLSAILLYMAGKLTTRTLTGYLPLELFNYIKSLLTKHKVHQ